MVGPGIFDSALMGILLIGIAIGSVFWGVIWLIIYICHHVTIGWAP